MGIIFIDSLQPEYNTLKIAGSRLGSLYTEKAKAKISKSMNGGNYSEETKSLMSLVKLGKNHPLYGKNHSLDTLKKMSIAKGTPIFVYNSDGITLVNTFTSSKKASEFFNCSDHTIKRSPFISGKLFKKQWILSTTLKDNSASS